MFVVIGEWRMQPHTGPGPREVPPDMVEGVGRQPGLVKGYWTSGDDDHTRSHTFIVFADRSSAEAFAADVRGNVVNQRRAGVENISLVIDEVAAHT